MYFQYTSRISFALLFFFFFNDTATTEIYTLSLHDALPILAPALLVAAGVLQQGRGRGALEGKRKPVAGEQLIDLLADRRVETGEALGQAQRDPHPERDRLAVAMALVSGRRLE